LKVCFKVRQNGVLFNVTYIMLRPPERIFELDLTKLVAMKKKTKTHMQGISLALYPLKHPSALDYLPVAL